MTLQPLPIADRLNLGAPLHRFDGTYFHRVEGMDLLRAVGGHKRIKLDDGQRVHRSKGQWDVSKIFGHLRLPFPMVWIEWRDFAGTGKGDYKAQGLPETDMALSCIAQPYAGEYLKGMSGGTVGTKEAQLEENSWIAFPYTRKGEEIIELPMILIVDITTEGILLGVRAVDGGADSRGKDEVTVTSNVVDLVWDGLVAIGWLNCRNVSLAQRTGLSTGLRPARKGKPQRKTTRMVEYHTIELPGGTAGEASGAGGSKSSPRLHHVRGHFKTFESDAPLLGKHVGTFWWGWQVRGSAERGVVISDYSLEVSQ
jgi:hypothetical protein